MHLGLRSVHVPECANLRAVSVTEFTLAFSLRIYLNIPEHSVYIYSYLNTPELAVGGVCGGVVVERNMPGEAICGTLPRRCHRRVDDAPDHRQ